MQIPSAVRLAFGSRELARAEQYRRRFGGFAAFGSYEAAAADPRVDALVICTPHHLHEAHARLAAGHGKAILLEKLRKGSSGSWGSVPMPANPDLSEADARRLIQWVLGGV